MSKINKQKIIISIAVFLILLFSVLYATVPFIKNNVNNFLIDVGLIDCENEQISVGDGEISIHFIDVGQGDSAVISTPDGNMLIDAGTGNSISTLRAYLKTHGFLDFEYVIFTHPHEDHIGGAAMIINEFNVKNIIIPDCVQTTKVYENMITAIENNETTVYKSVVGDAYNIGNMKFKILAPINEEYDNINNYSVVLRIDYGKNSIIMTGDAEELSENEMLQKFSADELKCDILKIGHHGSNTSTSDAFLAATNPTYAIISCGEGNKYGHPDREIIEKLTIAGITFYRTDMEQNIVFICNGETIIKK